MAAGRGVEEGHTLEGARPVTVEGRRTDEAVKGFLAILVEFDSGGGLGPGCLDTTTSEAGASCPRRLPEVNPAESPTQPTSELMECMSDERRHLGASPSNAQATPIARRDRRRVPLHRESPRLRAPPRVARRPRVRRKEALTATFRRPAVPKGIAGAHVESEPNRGSERRRGSCERA